MYQAGHILSENAASFFTTSIAADDVQLPSRLPIAEEVGEEQARGLPSAARSFRDHCG